MNLGIFLLFAAIQVLRSRWEEAKLRSVFPDYRLFAEKSRWFWK